MLPWRRHPTRANHVRAGATGALPSRADTPRHPVNHAADEHGSSPRAVG
jgi:hypothetical protein